jgi:hypothetical protein
MMKVNARPLLFMALESDDTEIPGMHGHRSGDELYVIN